MSSPLRSAIGATAALCALLGSPLRAQSVLEFEGEQVSVPWSPSQGSFGRSVHGCLTPGVVPDVVVLCGDVPFVLVDADPYDAKVQLALQVTDLDVLTAGAPGGADALATVGAAGLQLTWFDAAVDGFTSQTISGGAWSGARLVRAIDVSGDGQPDLVGVAADGVTLLVLVAQGPALSFAPAASGEAGAQVRDVKAVQWDGDAACELALLSDLGVEVREADGTPLDQWLSVLPGGAIARLRQQGMPTDRIAWITAYAPPAQQFLMTLAPGGATHDMVDLGALDAFAALGGDYDLDGDDDLLVSHHYSNELIWFENERSPALPTAHSFQAQSPQLTLFRVGPAGVGATLNQATPVRADLDCDGDLDLFYACQTSSTIEVLRGETVDQSLHRPDVAGGLWRPEAQATNGELVLSVALPPVVHAAATHVRLQVWERAAAGEPFEPVAVHVALVPLTATWPADLTVPIGQTTPEFDATYALELTLVGVDAQGEVAQQFPASLWEFMSSDATALDELLQEIPGSSAQPVPTDSSIPSSNGAAHLMKRPKMGSFKGGHVPYI